MHLRKWFSFIKRISESFQPVLYLVEFFIDIGVFYRSK
jgi:hypothetical protein